MREIKVICVDLPKKDVFDGTATLPHQTQQEYALQNWSDIRNEKPPKDILRFAYHLWAESDQQTATLQDWHNISIQQAGKEDIIVHASHIDIALSTIKNGGKPVVPPGYKPQFEEPGKTYVHYGSDVFGTHLFRPVSNERHEKPDGGFWASAVDAQNPWSDFAETGFSNYPIHQKVEFTLDPAARILKIDTIDDIAYLAATYPIYNGETELNELGLGNGCIDWQRVAMEFDGIAYNYENLSNQMATMDCDCICIFNPDIVKCCDPTQDISKPLEVSADPMELYAIEFYDIRDVAKPEWLTSMPPYNAASLHLYTTDEPFYNIKMSNRDSGAAKTEWGSDEKADMYEVAVMYKVTIPANIAQTIHKRLDVDETSYITAIPITAEMIQGTPQVKFHESTFTYGRMTTLENAPARADEVVVLTEFALPQWSQLDKDAKDWCEFLHATQAFETMYGVQGLVTKGFQPEDPLWQAPLCQIAQQVHESTLPFDDKLRIMKKLDEALIGIEEYQTAKVVQHRYYCLFAEMSRAANEAYNPELGMAISQWQEQLKSHPEEFTPVQEQIEID